MKSRSKQPAKVQVYANIFPKRRGVLLLTIRRFTNAHAQTLRAGEEENN